MKIEIWSDYACPFCYIGERKLAAALKQTGMSEQVELEFKSFELDPNSPKDYGESINELMAKKYGLSVEQATKANNNIINAAKEVGLNFNFDDLKPSNTFDAHRLSHYAKSQGKENEFLEAAMKSYFVDSKNISDLQVLTAIAIDIGLDKEKTLEVLSSTEFEEQVRADEQKAHTIGVTGVPYFLFDERQAVYGAQPVETFVEVINNLSKDS